VESTYLSFPQQYHTNELQHKITQRKNMGQVQGFLSWREVRDSSQSFSSDTLQGISSE